MKREELILHYLDDAWDLRRAGNYDESKKVLEIASKLCHKDDYSFLGRINHIYMQYEADNNNFNEAREFCQTALSYYVKAENHNKIAHSTRHLADMYFELNQFEMAEQNYLVAIEIYRNENDIQAGDLANALRGISRVLEKRMEFTKAIEVWQEILQIYTEDGFQDGVHEANEKIIFLNKTKN